MPEATDLLTELQEKRQELAAAMKDQAERRDDWSAEDEQQWERLNSEYDETMTSLEGEFRRVERDNQVATTLERIEADTKRQRNDRRIGSDHQNRKRLSAENMLQNSQRRIQMGFAGWILRQAGKPVRPSMLEAAKDCGFAMRPGATIELHRLNHLNNCQRLGWYSRGVSIRRYDWDDFEQRDLDLTATGDLVPEGFMTALEMKLLQVARVRQVARVVRTATGNPFPFPVADDTANEGEILAEEGTIGSSVDPTFAAINPTVYKYSSKPVLISAEAAMDSAFDLVTTLGEMCGTRIARHLGKHLTTGTGTGQPRGLVTATLADGTTQTANASGAIDSDDITDLSHAVDIDYRETGTAVGYMLHDNTAGAIRKLKTSDGALMWGAGLVAGEPDRLNGWPVTINNGMDSTIASGKESVLFGDFGRYLVRDAGPVRARVLRERYADTDQIAVITFSRHAAEALVPEAFAVLQHP